MDMKVQRHKATLMGRLLWQVEADIRRDVTLRSLADQLGVSPFHLTRLFSLHFGMSLMRYVRGRRLSEAARVLAAGHETVTNAGIDAGYQSAEGFSRAFRARFGVAPSSIRRPSDLDHLDLEEPITMTDQAKPKLSPNIREHAEMRVVGLSGTYSSQDRAKIPALWDRLIQTYDHLLGRGAYGVSYNFTEDGGFDYLAGFDSRMMGPSDDGDEVVLPAGTYAEFAHEGHIPTIGQTYEAIFSDWAPGAEYDLVPGPEFEIYAADFTPESPGGVTICIPVVARR